MCGATLAQAPKIEPPRRSNRRRDGARLVTSIRAIPHRPLEGGGRERSEWEGVNTIARLRCAPAFTPPRALSGATLPLQGRVKTILRVNQTSRLREAPPPSFPPRQRSAMMFGPDLPHHTDLST